MNYLRYISLHFGSLSLEPSLCSLDLNPLNNVLVVVGIYLLETVDVRYDNTLM